MAARESQRQVSLSNAALAALREIWLWNADRFGVEHAEAYSRFLENAINALSRPGAEGGPVPGRRDLRYLLIRRRVRGHGHVAVFKVVGDRVNVLRIFHTAQDWQSAVTDLSGQ
jgi:plasmid stabilization system protein ParE